jgi:hypothetical protein
MYKETIKDKVKEEYIEQYPHLEEVFEINFCRTDDGARIV